MGLATLGAGAIRQTVLDLAQHLLAVKKMSGAELAAFLNEMEGQ